MEGLRDAFSEQRCVVLEGARSGCDVLRARKRSSERMAMAFTRSTETAERLR
jgi:hypothetical protein